MDSEGRIIEVVLATEFSDYDRRTGNNKPRPKNWCRQFARPRKVSGYDSLDRLATASERTSSCIQAIHIIMPIQLSNKTLDADIISKILKKRCVLRLFF